LTVNFEIEDYQITKSVSNDLYRQLRLKTAWCSTSLGTVGAERTQNGIRINKLILMDNIWPKKSSKKQTKE